MDGLNLATLTVNIKASGVDQTDTQVKNLTDNLKSSEKTSKTTTSTFTKLGNTIKSSIGDTKMFGTSLSSLATAFTGGNLAATLLEGAVGGVTMALANMATQALQQAISGITGFIAKGIELASDLTEVQNVLDVTFGENAQQVNEWAENASSAFGLTELQAKNFSSTMGAMFTSMGITGEKAVRMSECIAQLSGDMASFNNLDIDVAFEKLRAGISGETEPLKQLGINMSIANLEAYAMSEGITKAYKDMTQAEQATLRYNYILSLTTNAQGDFARTQDSYANASRSLTNTIDTLGAKFGESLLPSLITLKTSLNMVLTSLQPLFSLLGGLAGTVLQAIATILTPICNILATISNILNPFFNIISKILDYAITGLNTLSQGINTVFKALNESLGLAGKEMTGAIDYVAEDISNTTGETCESIADVMQQCCENGTSSFEQMYESIQQLDDETYSQLKQNASEYNNEYKGQMDALDEYVSDTTRSMMKDWEESHKSRTKNVDYYLDKAKYQADVETKLEKQVAKEKEQLNEKYTKKLETELKNQQKLVEKYGTKNYKNDYDAFAANEEAKTKKFEQEQKKRNSSSSSSYNSANMGINIGYSIGSSIRSMITGHALGTPYSTGGLKMVGEHGRELIQLPRGSKVYNNRETENMLNGGGTVSNVYYVTIDSKNVQEFNDVISICQNARMVERRR